MEQPKLRIIPFKQTKEDKKKAKLMGEIINHYYKENKGFIDALTSARLIIEKNYGIKTQDQPWNLILQAYLGKIYKEMK